jgi:acetyltransferase-like isoleucine patch superfamily enzyme
MEHDWFAEPLPDNVVLGARTWLYSSFAFRHYCSRRPVGLRTGNDTGLYNCTFFDLGPAGEVSIGSYCTLVGAIICSNSRIVIGDHAFLAHEVVLADSYVAAPYDPQCQLADIRAERHDEDPETSIVIGDNTWIGARAVVLRGASIGEGSIVGAAAVVDFEVPPRSIVAGNPGRIVRRIES